MGRHHVYTRVERAWSPHIEAAAEAMYGRIKPDHKNPKWRDIDIHEFDHYCFAAQLAVKAFYESAVANIEVEW